MPTKLSEVHAGSSCTVIEIAGGVRVRQHLAKLGVLPRGRSSGSGESKVRRGIAARRQRTEGWRWKNRGSKSIGGVA